MPYLRLPLVLSSAFLNSLHVPLACPITGEPSRQIIGYVQAAQDMGGPNVTTSFCPVALVKGGPQRRPQCRAALETALRGRDEQNKRGATYLFSCKREGRRRAIPVGPHLPLSLLQKNWNSLPSLVLQESSLDPVSSAVRVVPAAAPAPGRP